MKKCGIYKITSPSKRIYIGQSNQIDYRWSQYKYYNYEKDGNLLLYRSLKKHGIENHSFEILEECESIQLDEKEIFWIDYYKCNFKRYPVNKGLNLTDGGNKPPVIFGRIKSQEELINISLKNINNFASKRIKNIHQYDSNGNLIKVWSDTFEFGKNSQFKYYYVIKCCKGELTNYLKYIWRFENDQFDKYPTKEKLRSIKLLNKLKKKKPKLSKEELSEIARLKNLGRKASEETRKKMSESGKKRWTLEKRLEQSKKFKGRNAYWKRVREPKEVTEKRMKKIRKPILQYDLNGNFIKEWISAKDVELKLGWNSDYVSLCARNKMLKFKNYIWKYKDGIIMESP